MAHRGAPLDGRAHDHRRLVRLAATDVRAAGLLEGHPRQAGSFLRPTPADRHTRAGVLVTATADFRAVDFLTDQQLAQDPIPYYDWLRECPVQREAKHGVVLVSGYDEAVAVWRDDKETFSACNVVSGPFPGLPVAATGDDISQVIEEHRD